LTELRIVTCITDAYELVTTRQANNDQILFHDHLQIGKYKILHIFKEYINFDLSTFLLTRCAFRKSYFRNTVGKLYS